MARSIWTGALTFDLVQMPVRLVSATRSHDVRFNMLCVDEGVRVRRKLVWVMTTPRWPRRTR